MDIKRVSESFAVSGQVQLRDVAALQAAGFRSLICNRPDGEDADQPAFEEIASAARAAGLEVHYIPVVTGKVEDSDVNAFARAYETAPKPVFGYCRSGMRAVTLWALAQAGAGQPLPTILGAARGAGYDIAGVVRRIANGGRTPTDAADATHDVVIVGGGAAGIAVASSLLARDPDLDIAIIDPADIHYYQPGWTLVGGGVFRPEITARTMGSLVPRGASWIKAAVAAFEPDQNAVILDGCRVVKYGRLVVCPGLKLDWEAVEGLPATLGRNGVTSNYRYDLAPYTWRLVKELEKGRALFTQPPMPIKCAGAPQKALYLSADHWFRTGRLEDIEIEFCNAGGVLFGVNDYVPALMQYIEKYRAQLRFHHRLTAIDGPGRKAWFAVSDPGKPDADPRLVEKDFDMIHVTPPQTAPDFIRVSPLADAAGWVDVDQQTLRHRTYANIWSLGDVMNAPNAKTAAAAGAAPSPTAAASTAATSGRRQTFRSTQRRARRPRTRRSARVPARLFGT